MKVYFELGTDTEAEATIKVREHYPMGIDSRIEEREPTLEELFCILSRVENMNLSDFGRSQFDEVEAESPSRASARVLEKRSKGAPSNGPSWEGEA